MKNLFLKSALALGFLFVMAGSAQAQGCLNEHKSIQLARQQCANLPSPSEGHFEAYLVSTPLCVQGSPGCAMVWDVWFVYECQSPPGTACRPLPPVLVATVSEGCDANRTVTCWPF